MASRDAAPRARGERTRRQIAEAVIAHLVEQGRPPTAKEVAARAGVSVRLLFHHFEDMSALYAKVAEVQLELHWRQVRPPSPDLPIDTRIDRTVTQRAKLYDAIAPVRRTAKVVALRRPDVAAAVTASDCLLHEWTSVTFTPELRAAGATRRDLLTALDVALSFEAWDRLRYHDALSSAASRRVVGSTVRGLLAGP